jgi:hypothetical protein
VTGIFWIFDSTLCVGSQPTKKDQIGSWLPDWANHARLLRVLKALRFSIEDDPKIVKNYRSLRKYHRIARSGDLFAHCETYPAGSNFEFYQEIVKENPNGGRYDFGKVGKMPYLIRKRFERAIAALRADLLAHGFTERTKVTSPIPDPLAYFNGHWDGEYERKRGVHRFERDETGWPSAKELGLRNRTDRDGAELTHGALRYARDHKGYLLRGTVYGGINGRWLLIYGPGHRDYTHVSAHELFTCSPAAVPRKTHPNPEDGRRRAAEKVRREMAAAVKVENFEVAARLRDEARRIESHARAA